MVIVAVADKKHLDHVHSSFLWDSIAQEIGDFNFLPAVAFGLILW